MVAKVATELLVVQSFRTPNTIYFYKYYIERNYKENITVLYPACYAKNYLEDVINKLYNASKRNFNHLNTAWWPSTQRA